MLFRSVGSPDQSRLVNKPLVRGVLHGGGLIFGNPEQSRLVNKPLVRGVLHGGGLIFDSQDDPAAKLIRYWINRPMPQGQDEFSVAANSMFTPADPATGACNSD